MRHPYSAGSAVLTTWLLSACAIDVPTDPQAFNLEPASVSRVRAAPQTLALNNGYAGFSGDPKQQFKVGPHTWIVDARQLTDTAVAMLKRALETRGMTAAANAEKTVTLRVLAQSASVQAYVGFAQTRVRVSLEALTADGTRFLTEADNMSPASGQRAFDGAVLFALNRLLADDKFVAYLNR